MDFKIEIMFYFQSLKCYFAGTCKCAVNNDYACDLALTMDLSMTNTGRARLLVYGFGNFSSINQKSVNRGNRIPDQVAGGCFVIELYYTATQS